MEQEIKTPRADKKLDKSGRLRTKGFIKFNNGQEETLKEKNEEQISESPSEYSANMELSNSVKKKGWYLKRGDKYVSDVHDSSDSALKTWKGMQDNKGIKIVKEDFDDSISIDEETSNADNYVLQSLADKDINASKVGKKTIMVHKDNLKSAKAHLRKIGYHNDYTVTHGLNEEKTPEEKREERKEYYKKLKWKKSVKKDNELEEKTILSFNDFNNQNSGLLEDTK